MATVVGLELGRHGLQLAAEKEVEKQRFDEVVAMMTQCDPGDAVLGGETVEDALAQARAQPAGGLPGGHHRLDDAVGVLFDDVEGHAQRGEVVRQHGLRKARLLLVEIDGEDLEVDRRAALQAEQDVQQRVESLPPERQTMTLSPDEIMP